MKSAHLALSPYRDVRDWILTLIDNSQRDQPRTLCDALPLTPEGVLILWARVLLTLHGRWRPDMQLLVRQLVQRLEWQPADGAHLLPMLAEVLHH